MYMVFIELKWRRVLRSSMLQTYIMEAWDYENTFLLDFLELQSAMNRRTEPIGLFSAYPNGKLVAYHRVLSLSLPDARQYVCRLPPSCLGGASGRFGAYFTFHCVGPIDRQKEKLYSINKIEFFEEWLKHEKDKRCDRLFEFISTKFNFSDITEECEREIKMKLASISSKIATRWVSSGKSKERQEIEFCVRSTLPQPSTSTAELSRPGRPRKDFEDASFKTKKRRVEDLVQSRSVGELMTAAEVAAQSTGQKNVARVIKDIGENPASASACLNIQQTSAVQRDRPLSNDEALAYYIDSKSTTHSYKQTRKWTMKVGHHVFPSYECIVKAKKGCYPSEEHIVVTQSRAEIELQAILNKTAERLIEAQREVHRIHASCSLFETWALLIPPLRRGFTKLKFAVVSLTGNVKDRLFPLSVTRGGMGDRKLFSSPQGSIMTARIVWGPLLVFCVNHYSSPANITPLDTRKGQQHILEEEQTRQKINDANPIDLGSKKVV
ncbi:hypothetical protein HW555_008593 [Spodoptera exigua]|uniref:Uncharacterized protein n=1 Tax=Spodoptera exigua TaxID=7107 RepID=A0A835GDN4_SPOEX|nr:hypothetical protein HW555_008593 [Spodoptera exigua]